MAIVGIDLGTTNSLIGVYQNNQVRILKNRLEKVMTPSVVSILDGKVLIGDVAKERQVKHPESSASAFKRFMGTEKLYQLENFEMGPVELSSLILKSLIEDAETDLGEKITEAVISVPAYFNDKQRNATIEAANLAGVKVNRLINEPTAAAVAYHMHDRKDETVIAIVDLGGGTFDVSILDIFDSIVEVRAVSGDNYLGGEDFDQVIVDYLLKEMGLNGYFTNQNLTSKLKYVSEAAKIGLTEHESVRISFQHNNKSYEYTLTEKMYEQMCETLLNKLKEPLKKAISDSNFKLSQIDEVILVGGSTRMPIVKKFVAKLFGKLPLCHLNPDEVVAIGATMTAAMVERHESFEDTVLTDVCPYTLGTSVIINDPDSKPYLKYDPIIERNETVPVSKSKVYFNAVANQKIVTVDVYQGDAFKLENNLKLGELAVPIPQGPEGSIRIHIRFTYDINGILEVEVEVPASQLKEKAILMNNNALSQEEIENRMLSLSHLKVHPRDQEENLYLISQAERLYELTLGKTREMISDEIILFNAILDQQNQEEIKRAKVRLKEFIRYMEAIN